MLRQITATELQQQPNFFADGFVIYVNDTQQVTERFSKREFGIRMEFHNGGQVYENYINAQCTGAKIDMLDDVKINDKVRVQFSVRGSIKDQKEGTPTVAGNPNRKVVFSNIDCWSILMIEPAAAAPVSGANPQPQAAGQQPVSQDDLPF